MSSIFLFLLLLVASNEGATGGGVCTEGFMDLSLLVAKAATPVGSLAGNTLAEDNEGRWIISYNTFNCNTAAVTEVILGVDIRSKHGNRNKHPSIEIWRLVQFTGSYFFENPVTIPIVLSPDNVTTNGLYRYVLPTPFSVSGSNYNTYRLGVYQPEDDSSVVRLYRATTSSTETVGRIRADSISESSIRVTGSNREIDLAQTTNVFMMHLMTNPPNCFQNFFTENEINTNSLSVTNVIPVNDTRAFPDIQFTCNGIITNWIIGITQNQDTSKDYPNIYLKRSSELIHALTVDASAATSSNGNVYNFTSDIEVEYGDILVINVTTNSNPMYYQQYNGPLNYELDNSNGLIPLEHNDYPLISVITMPISSVTEFSSTTITMFPDHSTSLHYTTLSSTSE
uniref:CUB-like domain-containing protein n=1 Tax=Amphimedon queenslandica TaxID=400682 RepID=A0A1X7TRN6_AMPQE